MTDLHDSGSDTCCIDVVELVSDFLEGAVDEQRRTAIDAHLRLREPCAEYVEHRRTTIQTPGHVPLHEAQQLRARVRDQLLAAFRADPFG